MVIVPFAVTAAGDACASAAARFILPSALSLSTSASHRPVSLFASIGAAPCTELGAAAAMGRGAGAGAALVFAVEAPAAALMDGEEDGCACVCATDAGAADGPRAGDRSAPKPEASARVVGRGSGRQKGLLYPPPPPPPPQPLLPPSERSTSSRSTARSSSAKRTSSVSISSCC